jgi:hypothetical protein
MARFVVRFEIIEQSGLFRVEPERLRLVDKPIALFRIVVRSRCFDFLAPLSDFVWSFLFSTLIQPFRHLLVARAIFDLGLEVGAAYPFEAEQHVVERTIEMIFPNVPCDQRPAFIDRASKNGVTAHSNPWAARRFFGQILTHNIFVHTSG